MDDIYVVYGWLYSDANPETPFAIEEFWIEATFDMEHAADGYARRLEQANSGMGDVHYTYSGPFPLNAESL
jgi:hypothetical protein